MKNYNQRPFPAILLQGEYFGGSISVRPAPPVGPARPKTSVVPHSMATPAGVAREGLKVPRPCLLKDRDTIQRAVNQCLATAWREFAVRALGLSPPMTRASFPYGPQTGKCLFMLACTRHKMTGWPADFPPPGEPRGNKRLRTDDLQRVYRQLYTNKLCFTRLEAEVTLSDNTPLVWDTNGKVLHTVGEVQSPMWKPGLGVLN